MVCYVFSRVSCIRVYFPPKYENLPSPVKPDVWYAPRSDGQSDRARRPLLLWLEYYIWGFVASISAILVEVRSYLNQVSILGSLGQILEFNIKTLLCSPTKDIVALGAIRVASASTRSGLAAAGSSSDYWYLVHRNHYNHKHHRRTQWRWINHYLRIGVHGIAAVGYLIWRCIVSLSLHYGTLVARRLCGAGASIAPLWYPAYVAPTHVSRQAQA